MRPGSRCGHERGQSNEKRNLRNQHYPGWLLRPHQTIGGEEILEHHTHLMRDVDLLVFGRKTYQLMVPYWPDVAKDQSETKADHRICSNI